MRDFTRHERQALDRHLTTDPRDLWEGFSDLDEEEYEPEGGYPPEAFEDEPVFEPPCPTCLDPIDYCRGHGELG